MQRSRRRPRFLRIIVTGAVVGFFVGVVVVLLSTPAPGYSLNTAIGYFGLLGAALGALVAGVVAALLAGDR